MFKIKNNLRRRRSDLQLEQIQKHQQITLIQTQIHQKILQTKTFKKNIKCQHMDFPQFCQQFQPKNNYYQKFWRLYLLNQMTKYKINELQQLVSSIQTNNNSIKTLLQKRQNILGFSQSKRKRIKAQEIQNEKDLRCPFPECYKQYISKITLQLHMKLKHGTASKIEQEKYAEDFWNWRQGKCEIYPKKVIMPPGYLQEYGMLTGRFSRERYEIIKQKHHWIEGVVDVKKTEKCLLQLNIDKKQNESRLENTQKRIDKEESQYQQQNFIQQSQSQQKQKK